MTIGRIAAAAFGLMLLSGVTGLAVEPRVLENNAVQVLGSGRCADAIAMLETLSDRERDARWFHIVATANLICARGDRSSAFQERARHWLVSGVQRFPSSIQLRVDRGEMLLDEGAWKEATESLMEAKDLLTKELEGQKSSAVQAEIRRRLRSIDEHLKRARERSIPPA
jgi:predicted Zn-dependent protease